MSPLVRWLASARFNAILTSHDQSPPPGGNGCSYAAHPRMAEGFAPGSPADCRRREVLKVWDHPRPDLASGTGRCADPTLFALQVLVVSGPHWRSRAWAVILGSGGVFAVFFALVLGGLEPTA